MEKAVKVEGDSDYSAESLQPHLQYGQDCIHEHRIAILGNERSISRFETA